MVGGFLGQALNEKCQAKTSIPIIMSNTLLQRAQAASALYNVDCILDVNMFLPE